MNMVNTGNKGVVKPRKRQNQARKALLAVLKKGEICSKTQAYLRLMDCWNSMLDKAIDGDVQAMKLIVERLDGKVDDKPAINMNINVAFDEALQAGRMRAAEAARAVEGNHTIIDVHNSEQDALNDHPINSDE